MPGKGGACFGGKIIISVWRGSVGSWKLTGASEDVAREVLALGSYSTLKYMGIEKITEEMVRKSILVEREFRHPFERVMGPTYSTEIN